MLKKSRLRKTKIGLMITNCSVARLHQRKNLEPRPMGGKHQLSGHGCVIDPGWFIITERHEFSPPQYSSISVRKLYTTTASHTSLKDSKNTTLLGMSSVKKLKIAYTGTITKIRMILFCSCGFV